MECNRPYYDVNFWELIYERESKLYMDFIIQKAIRLKALEAKDLFALPEQEAKQIQKQISILTHDLLILYGFKEFTNEMRNCYSDSIDKIYNAYNDRNTALQLANQQLRQENALLSQGYKASIDETLFCLNFSIELLEQVSLLKQEQQWKTV